MDKTTISNRITKAVRRLKEDIALYASFSHLKLCVSNGNSKIGRIKNISVAPILSCAGICKTCMHHCYDIKAVLQYRNVSKARARNFVLLRDNPMEFYIQARKAIAKQRKGLFRWNVGGELYNLTYLQIIVKLAREFPETRFLLFTKRHFLVNTFCERNGGRNAIPENLKLIFSMWPGMEMDNPYDFPVSCPYPDDKPETWVECPGNCETCANDNKGCWNLTAGQTVGFHYHGTDAESFREDWDAMQEAI